ncbi:methyltransferase [Thermogemmatispora sp.]|uniref:methyltransferase n=1 Tax=Thermogemmatispora sp. TaxID=1968838 RepID=UPI001D1D01FE|nr:methyltransferase [Thermogemmatispora sp.]MBX5450114.1 class I SAM-dependent methyltransferase [Thermogemmatispora sp.]
MLHPQLLADNVPLHAEQRLLILNSAADPFVQVAARQLSRGRIILAEDNVSALEQAYAVPARSQLQHIPFHEYTRETSPNTIDVAVMNLLYQPSKAWIYYGLEAARYALRPGGRLYVTGAKDRGILSIARRMREYFGNLETVEISKGWRVVAAEKTAETPSPVEPPVWPQREVFAGGELDEGTRLLLEVLEVYVTDVALDLGCGAGYIGMHIAERARKGSVTLVDASLAAVALAQQQLQEKGLTNAQALPSDATSAVSGQRFSLIATNPPFHVWGVNTKAIGERFIREGARLLNHRRGRFYLVANRFLKYEPVLEECFEEVQEVGGNSRYKVLRATSPVRPGRRAERERAQELTQLSKGWR